MSLVNYFTAKHTHQNIKKIIIEKLVILIAKFELLNPDEAIIKRVKKLFLNKL